jgi:selenocysteine-specific elongation factor
VRSLVVGTAGHIDHGKSTLVQALTGIDPDRLKEEKARGITIDLGFAYTDIDQVHVAFVDVPGHERFVRNMLAGVGGIDAVLLVVAADESVMPQTREHFDICRLLRIPAGVIALTKSDLVDADTLELTRLETKELVAGTFLADAPIVPVSARTGAGLPELSAALAALASRVPSRARDSGAVRLPIDRVFSMKGFGTVVTGTLVSGTLNHDAELVVAPAGRRVKVRGIQVHGRSQPSADAGHRVAANLGGIEISDVARGETLIAPETFEPTRRLDAVIELLQGARPLRHGTRVRFHHGTAELLGRVSLAALRERSGQPGKATPLVGELPPGREAYVRLRLESPAVLTRGDRFILRAYSPPMTIAGGEVLDPQPPRAGARTEAGRSRFEQMDAARAPSEVATVLLREAGGAGVTVSALAARLGLDVAAARGLIAQLKASAALRDLGPVVVASTVLEELGRAVIRDLEAHHRAQPLSQGMPREELRTRLFARAHDAAFAALLDDLARQGRIVVRDRIALASHKIELSPDEQRARDALVRTFRDAGLKPPATADVAAALGLPAALVDRMLKLLQREQVLVKIDELLFHADALSRLKQDLAALKRGAAPAKVDVGSFKEKYGISRKFAIPLLEYLDRERVTRRVGDSRVVL